MKRQSGFSTPIIILGIVICISTIGAGFWVYNTNKYHSDGEFIENPTPKEAEILNKYESQQKQTAKETSKESESEQNSANPEQSEPKTTDGFQTYLIRPGGVEQTSPVSTKVQSDKHVISLQLRCETSPCKFKLGSDDYPLGSQKTYSDAQTINYTLDKKGSWIFYNALNPVTKFQIVIE